MVNLILVAAGGASGALIRYVVDKVALAQLGSSATGTFFVNVSGSFLLGLLAGFFLSNPICIVNLLFGVRVVYV